MARVILDTNVWVSAMRSTRGPAYRLISLVGTDLFEIVVSVGLLFEYESVLLRTTALARDDVDDLLDYICSVAHHQRVFYLWRPYLRDPMDDLVLELAVASRSTAIVTFNLKDFAGLDRFDIRAVHPASFLREIEE